MASFLPVVYALAALAVVYFLYVVSGLKRYIEVAITINKFKGPPALPILGNIPQAMGTPVHIFKNLRHVVKLYGPTFRAWIGVSPAINTLCPDLVETLIGTQKHSVKGKPYELVKCWLNTGLLTSQGTKWHNRRKVLTPSFHFTILVQFVDIFNKYALTLVDNLKKSGEDIIEVTDIITEFTLHTICETSMGISLSDNIGQGKTYMSNVKKFGETVVQRLLNPIMTLDFMFSLTKSGAENRKVCKYLHEFSSNVIEMRSREFEKARALRGTPSEAEDDFGTRKRKLAMLDLLLAVKYDEGTIDDEGIREEVDTFTFEGHDTTALSLSYTLMLLACNKHCQEKVYEEIIEVLGDFDTMPTYNDLIEMKYLERCIKESLRLYPSVPIISRVADDGLIVDGHPVPEGCMMNVTIYDLHRDPKAFPDPEKFDPDRFLPENTIDRHPFIYIPFSAGPRNCIGQRFAMLEMKVCLIAILKNFILEPVDTPETIRLIPDLLLRTENGVRVKFVQRS